MKANELRLGNIIKRRSSEEHIIVDLDVLTSVQRQPIFFNPIPLTEEWMLKLGFKKDERGNLKKVFQDLELMLCEPMEGILLNVGNNIRSYFIPNSEYVHQLQNLYFALTGEELKVNH